MAVSTWTSAVSGAWANDSLWVGGVPNGAAAQAVIKQAGAAHTVTIAAGQSFTVASLDQGGSSTLSIGGTLVHSGGASFANSVTVQEGGTVQGRGSFNMRGGQFANAGLVHADQGTFLYIGTFFGNPATTVANTGTMAATGNGSTIRLDQVNFTGIAGGVLAGGIYEVTGSAGGGTTALIRISGPTGTSVVVDSLATTVRLTYGNTSFTTAKADGTQVTLENSLTTILPAGRLEVLGGRSWTSSLALDIDGHLQLGGGTFKSTGGISVGAGGVIEGFGTLASPVALEGVLRVAGGSMTVQSVTGGGIIDIVGGGLARMAAGVFDQDITGGGVVETSTGSLTLSGAIDSDITLRAVAGTTLDIAEPFGGTVVMYGTGVTVRFGAPSDFTGTLHGFQTGSTIDLTGVVATGASASGSSLNITTASGTISFGLGADYTGKTFNVAGNGAGGSLVTVQGVSFDIGSAFWAEPIVTWSLATANYALPLAVFSSFVDPVAQAAQAQAIRNAFAQWSAASGITFVEVPDSATAEGQAGIRVGWGNLPNPQVGSTAFSFQTKSREFNNGVVLRLQDPALTPLVSNSGTLVYQGTQSSLQQVALHEIGHALGLAHASAAVEPAAVMQPVVNEGNRTLGTGDIVGVRALYAGIVPAEDGEPDAATLSLGGGLAQAEGAGAFVFTVTRGGDTSGAHSATWSVTGTGANPANAADFAGGVLPSGTVNFAPGATSADITVNVAADGTVEPDETFLVTLSAPSAGATLLQPTSAGTIENDDATLSLGAGVSKSEGSGGGTTSLVFMVSRGGDLSVAHSAKWQVTGSGAAAANAGDFVGGVLPSGTVSFAPGATGATITVPVLADTVSEVDETFTLTLSNPSAGAAIGTASATGTIVNDDPAATPPTLSIAPLSASKPEGTGTSTSFTFTVTRSGGASAASATWTVAGLAGSGTVPSTAADFVGGVFPSGTVSFAPGETSRVVTVLVNADSASELNERFSVTLSNPVGAVLGTASAGAVVFNDDTTTVPGTLSASGGGSKAEGNAGTTPYAFTIIRSGDLTATHSASWSVVGHGGNPASASDFAGGVLPSGVVTFLPGQTSHLVTVQVVGDTVAESDEGFALLLSNPSAYTSVPGGVAASAVIVNDDTPTLSIAPLSASKPEGTGTSTPFTFTVTRSGGAGSASATWTVAGLAGGGTVPSTAADFVGGVFPGGTVSFAPGETSRVVTVLVNADSAYELNERFSVTLSNPVGAVLGTASAGAVVFDDDAVRSTAADEVLGGTPDPDVFFLGGGLDSVFGLGGVDSFRFQQAAIGPAASNATTMEDFSRALGERLDLSAIDAIAGTAPNDAFGFIGTNPFSGAPGELRWQDLGGGTLLVQGNVNADTAANLTIFVKAAGPVDANWFVL
jgi:hypothetical protein